MKRMKSGKLIMTYFLRYEDASETVDLDFIQTV